MSLDINTLQKAVEASVKAENGAEYQYRFADSNIRKASNYREYGRIMHGSNPKSDIADNIISCSPASPLQQILSYINGNASKPNIQIKINNDSNRAITVNPDKIKKNQREIEVYYNENMLNIQEIEKIQKYKKMQKLVLQQKQIQI